MSKDNLPEQVNPFRFAENGVALHGHLLIKEMPRLCTSLANDSGTVDVQAQFGVDDQGVRILHGNFKTQVMLTCQRCMEPFSYEIIADFVAGIVGNEAEVKQLPESYEPITVEEGDLNLPDVVEEELMLQLPIVPMHLPEECQVKLPLVAESTDSSIEQIKESPFKVIESLKEKK